MTMHSLVTEVEQPERCLHAAPHSLLLAEKASGMRGQPEQFAWPA